MRALTALHLGRERGGRGGKKKGGIGRKVQSSINYFMEEGEGEDVMDTMGRKLWGARPKKQS